MEGAVEVIKFTVYGQCYSMKNGKSGRGMRKHPKAVVFERDFALQVPLSAKQGIGSQRSPLEAWVVVYYPSFLQDVDVEIVWDLLQKCGVVSNDRWIRRKHIDGRETDRDRPRVEITISEM